MSTVTTIEIHARRKTNSYCEEWAKLMSSIGKEYLDKMKVIIPREPGFRLDRISGKVMVDKGTMIKLVGLDGKYNSDYFFLTYSELVEKPMRFDLKRKPEQYTLQWQKFCEKYGYEPDHIFRVEVPNARRPNEVCEHSLEIPGYGRCAGYLFIVMPDPAFAEPTEIGKKYDEGKPIMGAVPPRAIRSVAEVLTFGAKKYGRDNWQKVENAETRYLDAALRHINDYQSGVSVDEESGKPTLAHAICDLMFILEKNLEKTK